jgi:phage terminase small subunit
VVAHLKPSVRAKAGTSASATRQRRSLFVEAYITNGGNATDAAIEAGYSRSGARTRGNELVKDRNISEEIDRRRREILNKARLTTEEVIASLAIDIRFDPIHICNDPHLQ